MEKRIVIIGSGVAGINAATTLVKNGYPGGLITIIDKGRDPYERQPDEVMCGFAGAGAWSDGKLVISTSQGGQLSKYCGDITAIRLMEEVVENFREFHPRPEEISLSNPKEEPDFIKPYFELRLSPVYHIGSNYLHEIAKSWYQYLVKEGVRFWWHTEITDIDLERNKIMWEYKGMKIPADYDKLIFAPGKSGIEFTQQIVKEYNLPTEPKSVQIGVRFEAPQKYFQKLIDVSYDFKLYQKYDKLSIRSFCTNNNAAYVAVEETYGNVSYNGHAKKGEEYRNDMTNFGILMEIKGIENPFEWSREVVQKCNYSIPVPAGLYYSPNYKRHVSKTSEDQDVLALQLETLDIFKKAFGEYADYILNFIDDMDKVFHFGDDWGMYIPEVKYLSDEVIVNYSDLSLINYPNVYFAGDTLSARGITVSGAQGIYIAESILKTR